ncbi:ribonuclease P protein subunit RPR2 SCDLUD_005190 [Saccharomycodes ludwigii]|uniref:ribonuclease P protein subunit RPR2 n=1 Tax=Saccharomycodes ludwigii TaxID=36035 RepID=UPI001E876C27|nr:hypothetical protein SCDLUD_005190 [Saccharomycodes ludwigii]KAH3898851.1 hypothetical protein SCDLUD_005190 [Saccharomycodes ludwigii]
MAKKNNNNGKDNKNKNINVNSDGLILIPPPKSLAASEGILTTKSADHYGRINYLFQLSNFMKSKDIIMPNTSFKSTSTVTPTNMKNTHLKDNNSNNADVRLNDILSSLYNLQIPKIQTKMKLQLSPNMKRQICPLCSELLIPGLSLKLKVVNWNHAKINKHRAHGPTTKSFLNVKKPGKKNQKNNVLLWKCTKCGKIVKKFPIGQDLFYQPFYEKNIVKYINDMAEGNNELKLKRDGEESKKKEEGEGGEGERVSK